jgi:hypothetical protein
MKRYSITSAIFFCTSQSDENSHPFLDVVLECFGQVVMRGNSMIQAIERIHVATTSTTAASMNPSTNPTMTAMAE